MDFQIALVGLNHRTASVDVRERFALADRCSPESWALPCQGGLSEALILSTCNRVELLGIGHTSQRDKLLELWAGAVAVSPAEISPYIYIHENLDAVRHLFEVASSLDSMVLGEPQILGQLKAAYRNAVNSHSAGLILNSLMHKAFSVAKRVRNETAVAASAVSISYAAVELAKRIFGDMPSHKAMLLGAGEMAELAAMHLLQAGIDEIIVLNRTLSRGEELARRFGGRAFPFDALEAYLRDVDIVIASTGSAEPIVCSRQIQTAMKARKNRPMFFIDIAVPRDIEPDVNNIDNVYLYDIDDLKDVVEENLAARREEAGKAMLIVREEVDNFGHWLENLKATPTILDLVRRGEAAAEVEVARTLKRLGPIKPEMAQAIEVMAKALARKLNHEPIMFLKDEGMGVAGQPERINLVRRIFNLDKGELCRKH